MYSKILVTVDGSPASESIVPEVAKAAGPGTIVTLLTVVDVPSALANAARPQLVAGAPAPGGVITVPGTRTIESRGQAVDRVKEEHTHYLESLAKPLRELGLNISTKVGLGPDAGEEILKTARALEVDAIFMATHGRTALGQIVFGSVAEKVMQGGVCPVLMVRPGKLN